MEINLYGLILGIVIGMGIAAICVLASIVMQRLSGRRTDIVLHHAAEERERVDDVKQRLERLIAEYDVITGTYTLQKEGGKHDRDEAC